VNIRAFEKGDLEAVKKMYDPSLGYEFPDLENPLFFIKIVGEQDGQIVQGAFAHLTAEIYFLLRKDVSTPQQRHLWFLEMQEVGRELARKPGGLDDLHAFLPPQLERAFAKRLMVHGWKRSLWPAYFVEVNKNG
jgi:hypothetical protein